jgi:hypothetical protein
LADGLLTLVHQDGADRSEDQRDRSDNNTTDLMILIAVPLRRPRVVGFFNHVRNTVEKN